MVALMATDWKKFGTDVPAERTDGSMNLRRDQFYGVSLASAIREYLTMRRAAS